MNISAGAGQEGISFPAAKEPALSTLTSFPWFDDNAEEATSSCTSIDTAGLQGAYDNA
jgi:hypothetical protein